MKKTQLFWQYLSMMCIIVLLCLGAFSIGAVYVQGNVKNEYLIRTQETFINQVNRTSEEIFAATEICSILENDSNAWHLKSGGGELPADRVAYLPMVMNCIKKQAFMLRSTDEVAVYFEGTDSIVTRSTCYMKAKLCFENHIVVDGMSGDEILDHLKTCRGISLLPARKAAIDQNEKDYLLLTYRSTTSRISLMAFIPVDRILKNLDYTLYPEGTALTITDKNGQVLYREGNCEGHDERYMVTADMPHLQTQVRLYLSDDFLMSRSLTVLHILGLIAVCMGIVGLIVSVLFARRAARPIRQMVTQNEGTEINGNELVILSNYLSKNRERITELQALLRESRLIQALSGHLMDSDSRRQFVSDIADITPPYRYARFTGSSDYESLLPVLRRGMGEHFAAASVNLSQVGILFSADYLDADVLQQWLDNNAYLGCKCGISAPFTEAEDLPEVVRQTLLSMSGDRSLSICEHEFVPGKTCSWAQRELLYQSLLSGETEVSVNLASAMLQAAFDSGKPKEIFYCVASTVSCAAEELHVANSASVSPEYDDQSTAKENADRLYGFVSETASAIHDKLTATSATEKEDMLIVWVNRHLSDSGLCIAMAADGTGMNEKKIQEIIRSRTGMSFLEYCTHIRIEKAKQLLEHSSLSIQEVSEQCGFAALSTFYRIFKRSTGVPPASFRENAN